MSLNERVALLQALEYLPESDRQIACGELLLLLLVALRQATSEDGIIALPEEARKFIEQKAIEGVADVLTQCFGLKTLYPGILNTSYNDVRRDLQGLMYQLSSSDSSDDLLHLVSGLLPSELSHESIGKSHEERMTDMGRKMHKTLGAMVSQGCAGKDPTDEELLERA